MRRKDKEICPGLVLWKGMASGKWILGWVGLGGGGRCWIAAGRRKSNLRIVGNKLAEVCSWTALYSDMVREPYWKRVAEILSNARKLGMID